jgi:hypothetical protein
MSTEPAVYAINATPECTIITTDVLMRIDKKNTMTGQEKPVSSISGFR